MNNAMQGQELKGWIITNNGYTIYCSTHPDKTILKRLKNKKKLTDKPIATWNSYIIFGKFVSKFKANNTDVVIDVNQIWKHNVVQTFFKQLSIDWKKNAHKETEFETFYNNFLHYYHHNIAKPLHNVSATCLKNTNQLLELYQLLKTQFVSASKKNRKSKKIHTHRKPASINSDDNSVNNGSTDENSY